MCVAAQKKHSEATVCCMVEVKLFLATNAEWKQGS